MAFLEILDEVGGYRIVKTDDAVGFEFQQGLTERGMGRIAHANV